MNRTLALLAIVLLTVACGKKNNFNISGKIDGGAGKTVYLNHLLTNSQIPVDSVKLNKAGEFKLKGKVSAPTFFLLKFSDRNFITLIPDSAENLTITGSYNHFATDYEVKGSDNSAKVRDLTLRFSGVKSKLDSIRQLYQKHLNDAVHTADLERWNNEYTKRVSDYSGYVNEFVKDEPILNGQCVCAVPEVGRKQLCRQRLSGDEDSCFCAKCIISTKRSC